MTISSIAAVAVLHNNSTLWWGRLRNVIAKEGVPAPVAGMFYQAFAAASESWVLPDAHLACLEEFHVECARILAGMWPRKHGEKRVYSKFANVLQVAGLQRLCTSRRKLAWVFVGVALANTLARKYIPFRRYPLPSPLQAITVAN